MASAECTPGNSKYTGPACPPDDATGANHDECFSKIPRADISDVPDLPSDITPPEAPSSSDITEEVLSGGGVFDSFMRAGSNQLQSQYDAGRIKGADYAAAYIQMMELMMTQANMFVLKKFESEVAASMFKAQYQKAMFDVITAEYQANKMIADAHLTSVQACELPLNSAADRILKEEQAKAQAKTVDLYNRQIKGFDEKNTEAIFKIIMDAWAAQGVEITAIQADSVLNSLSSAATSPKPGTIDQRVATMMTKAGITLN